MISFQGNLSLVTRRRYAMARQASAATKEDVFERAVNLGLLSRVQNERNETTNNFEHASSKTFLPHFDACRLRVRPVRAGGHDNQSADRVD